MTTKKAPDKQDESSTTPAVAVVAPPKPATASHQTHCPYRQAALLQQALTPDKMRVAFFLGAGCPVAIRVPNATGSTDPLIPDINDLTKHVRSKVEASEKCKVAFSVILKRLADDGITNPNIEQILTLVRALGEVIGSGFDGINKTTLTEVDEEICRITTEIVKAKLPGDETRHPGQYPERAGEWLCAGQWRHHL